MREKIGCNHKQQSRLTGSLPYARCKYREFPGYKPYPDLIYTKSCIIYFKLKLKKAYLFEIGEMSIGSGETYSKK